MMDLASTSRVLKALGHPARLRIASMLRDGELCACQITAVLDLAPSTVSAHLAELRRAALITERRDGRWVHYALATTDPERAMLAPVWDRLRDDDQIASDRRIVRQLRAVPVERLCSVDLDLEVLSIFRTTVAAGTPDHG